MTTIAEMSHALSALSAAREILKQNPNLGPVELSAKELRPLLKPKLGLHEYDCFCQRCGKRDGSRFLLDQDAPAEGYLQTVCFDCSAGDQPGAE